MTRSAPGLLAACIALGALSLTAPVDSAAAPEGPGVVAPQRAASLGPPGRCAFSGVWLWSEDVASFGGLQNATGRLEIYVVGNVAITNYHYTDLSLGTPGVMSGELEISGDRAEGSLLSVLGPVRFELELIEGGRRVYLEHSWLLAKARLLGTKIAGAPCG